MDKVTSLANKAKAEIDKICTAQSFGKMHRAAESAITNIIKLHSARMNEGRKGRRK